MRNFSNEHAVSVADRSPKIHLAIKAGISSDGTTLSADDCEYLNDVLIAIEGIQPEHIQFIAHCADTLNDKGLSLSELSRLAKRAQCRAEEREPEECEMCGGKS